MNRRDVIKGVLGLLGLAVAPKALALKMADPEMPDVQPEPVKS